MAEQVGAGILVEGVVQGVGYRFFAINAARRLGVDGWVRNRPDGSVELEVEGDKSRLLALINELKVGPRWAQVRNVQVEWRPYKGIHHGFNVRY